MKAYSPFAGNLICQRAYWMELAQPAKKQLLRPTYTLGCVGVMPPLTDVVDQVDGG
jgi:hypothetical protein